MPFADEYVISAHPPLPLHSKVPRPWALDAYSMVNGIGLGWDLGSVGHKYVVVSLYILSLNVNMS